MKSRKSGGKSGTLKRLIYLNNSDIFGAGGYGICVISPSKKEIFKLLYDISACTSLKNEAIIQNKAYNILLSYKTLVTIPKISFYSNKAFKFNNTTYLCGIGMKYLPPPLDFDESVHIILGYKGNDIDTSWGRKISDEIGSENPTRGFFASPETMEYIWSKEESNMTIEKMATIMGKTIRTLLENQIIPIDIEWIWSNGKPAIIDFGLCEEGKIDPLEFLELGGSRGLSSDLYIPHKGDRGYEEFLEAYLS
jgi:hypothetical protein